jgi:hypothetical protein
MPFSGIWYRMALLRTDVSEERITSIIRWKNRRGRNISSNSLIILNPNKSHTALPVSLEFRTIDNVQVTSDVECYTLMLESFRFQKCGLASIYSLGDIKTASAAVHCSGGTGFNLGMEQHCVCAMHRSCWASYHLCWFVFATEHFHQMNSYATIFIINEKCSLCNGVLITCLIVVAPSLNKTDSCKEILFTLLTIWVT